MLLRTLGSLTLEGADFHRPKPLLLLAYLALEGPTERRYLAELFWMEAANARRSLATALSQLRQGVPDSIRTDEVRVWTTVACDARPLRDAVGQEELLDAFAAYRGPFLQGLDLPECGVELEEWIYGTREALAGRAREALLVLAERNSAAGETERAARKAEQAYRLPEAPELETAEMERIMILLRAGGSLLAKQVEQEAAALGIPLPPAPPSDVVSPAARMPAIPPHPLRPAPLSDAVTSFVGRKQELLELTGLLEQPECRLVSVTGLGGSGKTRLALRFAHEQQELGSFEQVAFMPLDAITDPASLPTRIATALGIPLAGTDALLQVTMQIGDGRVLLVLDNFEHLLGGASLIPELLRACPHLKVLTTTREPLGLAEEWLFPLDGLPLPDSPYLDGDLPDRNLLSSDALRLFLERATQANTRLPRTPETQRGAMRVCRLVDGSPLGIELAAAWVHLMPPETIAREIERNLDLLTSRRLGAPDRHRSVRTTFEYSWGLLPLEEREVLRRLPVFKGGFTLAAGEEIARAPVTLFASLVDKALLKLLPDGRYDLHPLVRSYAQEKLTASPDEHEAVQERHSRYYIHLLQSHTNTFWTAEGTEISRVLSADFENLRRAWLWAAKTGQGSALRSAAEALLCLTDFRGSYQESIDLLADAEAMLEESRAAPIDLAYLQAIHAWLLIRVGRFTDSEHMSQHALDIARAERDEMTIIAAGNTLVGCLTARGELLAAKELHLELHSLILEHGIEQYFGPSFNNLAEVEAALGEYASAEQHYREALAHSHSLWGRAHVLSNLAGVLLKQNRPREALPFALQGLQLEREHDPENAGGRLVLAETHLMLGQPEPAEALCHEALALCRKTGTPTGEGLTLLGRVATAQGEHGIAEEHFREAIRISWYAGSVAQLLATTAHLADMWREHGKQQESILLLRVVRDHPATEHHVRERAKQLICAAGRSSPADAAVIQPDLNDVVSWVVQQASPEDS